MKDHWTTFFGLTTSKLAYADKNKIITFQKLGSCDSWSVANSVLNKGKSALSLLYNDPNELTSASDREKKFVY